jgi:hypothetical protein
VSRTPSLFDEAPTPKPAPIVAVIGTCGECAHRIMGRISGPWCAMSGADALADRPGCGFFEAEK